MWNTSDLRSEVRHQSQAELPGMATEHQLTRRHATMEPWLGMRDQASPNTLPRSVPRSQDPLRVINPRPAG